MKTPIGGYYELELNNTGLYHQGGIYLNTGRNCLEYIIRAKKYRKIYIPYYTCSVILEPLEKLNVEYQFYNIDSNLDPIINFSLKKDEAFLYTNYFGLKQKTVEVLAEKLSNLIIDNAQAFFCPPLPCIDTFYSPRKFFGIPDGGILFTNSLLNIYIPTAKSIDRLSHLFLRIEENAEYGYNHFKTNDQALNNLPIQYMSRITDKILSNIDYKHALNIRNRNFKFLHEKLGCRNKFHFDQNSCKHGPMVYPFWTENHELREILIKQNIYIAKYWPNVTLWTNPSFIEYILTEYVVPLPVDQRYEKQHMELIIGIINKYG